MANKMRAGDSKTSGQAEVIKKSDVGEVRAEILKPAEVEAGKLEVPSSLRLTREQLTTLRAGQASLQATITIKRAGTGKEETYSLVLTPRKD